MKDKIRRARKEAGFTQKGLAEILGCGQLQITRWETGKTTPHPNTLAKIAEATGKPINWFTTSDEMTLDLAVKLPEKTLGKLVKAAHENERPVSDEAAAAIVGKFGK